MMEFAERVATYGSVAQPGVSMAIDEPGPLGDNNDRDQVRFREEVLERQFAFLCASGVVVFMVDAAALWLILHFTQMDPITARAWSFLGGALTFWMLQRHLTFPAALRLQRRQPVWRFVVMNSTAAVVNLGVYAALVLLIGFFFRNPVLAVAISCGLALPVSIWMRRTMLFG